MSLTVSRIEKDRLSFSLQGYMDNMNKESRTPEGVANTKGIRRK